MRARPCGLRLVVFGMGSPLRERASRWIEHPVGSLRLRPGRVVTIPLPPLDIQLLHNREPSKNNQAPVPMKINVIGVSPTQGRSQKSLGLLEVTQYSVDPPGLELRLSVSKRPAVDGELLLESRARRRSRSEPRATQRSRSKSHVAWVIDRQVLG